MSHCPICDCEDIKAGDVTTKLLNEFWPDDGKPDYVGLKRALEAEYGLELTVSKTRKHVDDHIVFSLGGGK